MTSWSTIMQGWVASLPGWIVVVTVAYLNSKKARTELKAHVDKVADSQTEALAGIADDQTEALVNATATLTDAQTSKLAKIVTSDTPPEPGRTT